MSKATHDGTNSATHYRHKTRPIMAWHLVGDTMRDGSPVPDDGVWTPRKIPMICHNGWHASQTPLLAAEYAKDSMHTLCQVELAGHIQEHKNDKYCAEYRRIVKRMPVKELFIVAYKTAVLAALDVYDDIQCYNPPPFMYKLVPDETPVTPRQSPRTCAQIDDISGNIEQTAINMLHLCPYKKRRITDAAFNEAIYNFFK